jgi:hypothetical protein
VSALEEYRKFEVLLRFGSHVTQQDVDAVAEGVRLLQDKADAAIAELEAENERWKDWHSRFTDDYRELRLLRAEKAEKTAPEETCGTCAHEWAGTCTHEAAKDRPAPYVQTCRYATSQWTRKGITR